MKKGDLVRAKLTVSIVVPKGSIGIIIDPPRRGHDAATGVDPLQQLRYVRWFSPELRTWAPPWRLEVISEER